MFRFHVLPGMLGRNKRAHDIGPSRRFTRELLLKHADVAASLHGHSVTFEWLHLCLNTGCVFCRRGTAAGSGRQRRRLKSIRPLNLEEYKPEWQETRRWIPSSSQVLLSFFLSPTFFNGLSDADPVLDLLTTHSCWAVVLLCPSSLSSFH